MHIERVLKITTAQTLAIDSLERKITGLSKRQAKEEPPVTSQKTMLDLKKQQSTQKMNIKEEVEEGPKFKDMFPDV